MNLLRLETKKGKLYTTLSNVSTTKAKIRPTAISVHSGNTDSIGSGTARRCKSSEKSEPIWFAYLWIGQDNDFKNPKKYFYRTLTRTDFSLTLSWKIIKIIKFYLCKNLSGWLFVLFQALYLKERIL